MAGRTVGVKSATFYSPGWRALVDGPPVEVGVTPVRGTMRFPVPAGEHRVTLRLVLTPLRRAALWVSLGVAALLGCGTVGGSRVRARRQAGGWRDANSTSNC